jgi:ABC-type nickel/cobalt efflux system permease component RcnA
MPTARSVITGTGGAVLLLVAVAILVIGRDALDEALPPALVHAAAWAAIAGGCWLLVHGWNARRREPPEAASPGVGDTIQR